MKENRSFKYGDGLFETIRVSQGKILNLENHFKRLHNGFNTLDLLNPNVSFSINNFETILSNEINKKSDANSRIRITFFRKGGGLYTPVSNSFDFFIESSPLKSPIYELNKKGLELGICSKVKLTIDSLSNLKTTSALPYVLAGIEKKQEQCDDLLILNYKNKIAESIAANVFLVRNNTLYTPALTEGCVAGIMRQVILRIAKEEQIKIVEKEISINDLKEADELFLTNAIRGIQWVKSIRSVNTNLDVVISKFLLEKLNKSIM